jgi:hypothetical protein
MQQVWSQLLDADFVKAYSHGFVMECVDGRIRRFYPRIFTYSADYPEKYVLYITGAYNAEQKLFTEFCLLQCEIRVFAPVHDALFARLTLIRWVRN